MQENEFETKEAFGEEGGFIIGEDFNIESQPEPVEEMSTNKKQKKKKKMPVALKAIIWIVSVLIVSISLAFGIVYATADYLGVGFDRGKECVIEIKKGSSTEQIAEKLNECGAVKIPLLFRVYTKLKHYDGKYKYGVYRFNTEKGYGGLARMLMTDGAKADSKKVTIPEGKSVDDIAKILEDNGVCTKSDFLNEVRHGDFDYDFVKEIPTNEVYYRLEGYLFPDTYEFYCYDSKECAHLAVDKMLNELNEKIKPYREQIKKSGYSFHKIMTMASLVELEAGGSKSEMANVAAVFYNRLNHPEKGFATLGSSPTRKYPYGNGRYNTDPRDGDKYIEGLPVGPLCSPSISAINAALNPTKDFDYYYFVTDAKMQFYYRKTLKEHNAIIAKLKAEKNWIYES